MRKLLKLSKRILISNYRDLKMPYRFTYIVTYKCRFRCNMCNIWQRTDTKELSLPQINEFFKKSNKFSWINLSGGEIFLRKDILDIINAISEHCKDLYLLDFPTTGFQTDFIVDTIKRLLYFRIPKLLVTISLDGPPHIHDKIRGVSNAWNNAVKTFDSLRKLRSNNFNVFFGMTLQSDNLNKFTEMVESVNSRIGGVKFSDFHINLIHRSNHYYGNVDTYEFNLRKALWDQLKYIMKLCRVSRLNPIGFLEKRYRNLCRTYLYTNKTPVLCQALSASFFMDPSGNIYPCSAYDKIIGNVTDFDYDISKLWNTYSRKRLRSEICEGICPQCWTPCEAYQSILADILPKFTKLKK